MSCILIRRCFACVKTYLLRRRQLPRPSFYVSQDKTAVSTAKRIGPFAAQTTSKKCGLSDLISNASSVCLFSVSWACFYLFFKLCTYDWILQDEFFNFKTGRKQRLSQLPFCCGTVGLPHVRMIVVNKVLLHLASKESTLCS